MQAPQDEGELFCGSMVNDFPDAYILLPKFNMPEETLENLGTILNGQNEVHIPMVFSDVLKLMCKKDISLHNNETGEWAPMPAPAKHHSSYH